MDEERQLTVISQNIAGRTKYHQKSSLDHSFPLGPGFLTPDTITLLGVLSMMVLFIRKFHTKYKYSLSLNLLLSVKIS